MLPMQILSGASFRRGDFAPRAPEFVLGCELLSPEFGAEFWNFSALCFPHKKSPLKNSPSRNSPPEIHIQKFTPEFRLNNSIALLQRHVAEILWD